METDKLCNTAEALAEGWSEDAISRAAPIYDPIAVEEMCEGATSHNHP